MPYSAQQHGSVALSISQELSSTSYRIETGLKKPLSPVAATEGRAGQSLRIWLLLAAEAEHGQIVETIDQGHRDEAVPAASGQSPPVPSSPWRCWSCWKSHGGGYHAVTLWCRMNVT